MGSILSGAKQAIYLDIRKIPSNKKNKITVCLYPWSPNHPCECVYDLKCMKHASEHWMKCAALYKIVTVERTKWDSPSIVYQCVPVVLCVVELQGATVEEINSTHSCHLRFKCFCNAALPNQYLQWGKSSGHIHTQRKTWFTVPLSNQPFYTHTFHKINQGIIIIKKYNPLKEIYELTAY